MRRLKHLAVASIMAIAAASLAAQTAGLRVVVIEGEDAVNIIQQKTAVRPVVEVRDRNNLPVSGALVTFSIEGGKAATFGGASTLTVATNAAGQAAVSGLTPSAAGAFQIQVSAAFQGQVATATIAQTNVMTAAQAAAATAASGSGSAGGGAGGGAAGGGGGLSTTTIAVAGAAVAGGALAAAQLADQAATAGAVTEFTGSFSGTITGTVTGALTNCSFTRSASAQARLHFDERSDTSVRGSFQYEGSDAFTSSNCPGSFPPPPFVGRVDVTGTPSRFSGQNTFPIPLTDPTTSGEHIYSFEGSLNGDTATGTFKYEQKFVNPGIAGPINTVSIGTFTITFQKS
jgi:hypothetical protein